MAKSKKRIFTSLLRLFMALFSVAILVFGYFWFAYPSDADKTYNLFGLEIEPMTMGYISIALIVIAFITHTSGQIVFWCKKDSDPISKQLMCGPLYINALYLALIVIIILI